LTILTPKFEKGGGVGAKSRLWTASNFNNLAQHRLRQCWCVINTFIRVPPWKSMDTADDYYPDWGCLVDFFAIWGWKTDGMAGGSNHRHYIHRLRFLAHVAGKICVILGLVTAKSLQLRLGQLLVNLYINLKSVFMPLTPSMYPISMVQTHSLRP